MRSFDHHQGSEKLESDESPFIHLTTNPRYLDVLCVNCYECVRLIDVDRHSQNCGGKLQKEPNAADYDSQNFGNVDLESALKKQFGPQSSSEDDEQNDEIECNEKIEKLIKAVRLRLFEI